MLKNLKGDILGGIVSAFIALPLTLACGVLLFKGISGFDNIGINAAIFSAIIASFMSAFIGSHSLQISGPRVVTTLILADFLYNFYHDNITIVNSIDFTYIFILLIMIIVVLSGFFQIIFSFLRVGELIKFLPVSVTMGVSTTIGLLIIIKQIPILFKGTSNNHFLRTLS
jgi:SulP family sulfate permease